MFNRKRIERLENRVEALFQRLLQVEGSNLKCVFEESLSGSMYPVSKVCSINLIDMLMNHLGIKIEYRRQTTPNNLFLVPIEKPGKNNGGKK